MKHRSENLLESLIEKERAGLMQVFSILRCLYDVLLYSDDDDATLHADVARACGSMINESVGRLEVLIRRYKAGEFRSPPVSLAVEPSAARGSLSPDREDETAEGE